ncbi:MAG TPA: hypothetical protein VL989_00010 [Candidatus Sulfotelmatobacter sp.]|nr:hypothetical protein [Candidatus Sulfotelmatobacter sp.]
MKTLKREASMPSAADLERDPQLTQDQESDIWEQAPPSAAGLARTAIVEAQQLSQTGGEPARRRRIAEATRTVQRMLQDKRGHFKTTYGDDAGY